MIRNRAIVYQLFEWSRVWSGKRMKCFTNRINFRSSNLQLLIHYFCIMTATIPWYKEWFNSPYYHLLYFKRDEAEAKKFIDNILGLLHPDKNSFMLDAACGRGRLSKILAAKGFDVTGIDLATENIRYAKQFESENLHFFVHDMRLPFWINYFNCAFNFFTSFGYFDTRREHEDAIRTIAQSIKPDGTFILDFLNVHYAEDHFKRRYEVTVEKVNFMVTKWYDETHFYKKIIVEDEQRDKPLEFTEKVAKFSLGDFTEMFAYYGLQVVNVYGDYDFNSYHIRNSPRMVIIAKKVKNV